MLPGVMGMNQAMAGASQYQCFSGLWCPLRIKSKLFKSNNPNSGSVPGEGMVEGKIGG